MFQFRVIDAFTDRPFAGNPAAVVRLESWPEDAWLQNVAMEMNLAETAFLVREGNGYRLRWFTPKIEVDLCGHATLAAAADLAEDGLLDDGQRVTFQSRSGPLVVERNGSTFEMDFPIVSATACEPPANLIDALKVRETVFVGRNKFDYLIELASAGLVRSLRPDFSLLSTIPSRGFIVTAISDVPDIDFISRFFAPGAGIDEDPVTGSAHCCLVDFWSDRLQKKSLVGYQASKRGGEVIMQHNGPRVTLSGKACIFSRGSFSG